MHFLGYPGDVGGANTECWHLVRLWRRGGIGVTLTPTWRSDPAWEARLRFVGAKTVPQKPRALEFPAGSVIVGMCNAHFIGQARRLREAGHKLVYLPCMNWVSDPELRYLTGGGRMDAWVFQSDYQRDQWQSTLDQFGELGRTRVIRGAFEPEHFPLDPRGHGEGEPFVVGRLSRPDPAKFHPQTWELYGRIPGVRARVMAWNQHVEKRLGPPPAWAEVLAPNAEPVRQFLASLHCLVQLNDQAVENWPRVGLEAMAGGVPVIADNRGGWREMIEHGVSGYLVDSLDEAAYYATLLARDRQQRMAIILAARKRVEELSRPAPIAAAWESLFEELQCAKSKS